MPIRDFIYLDTEMLESYYAQVFEGVTERIVEDSTALKTSRDRQKGQIGTGSTYEAEIASASQTSESRVLHDHMFSLLESKLEGAGAILNFESAEDENKIKPSSFIRVTGRTDIEDYNRLTSYLSNFTKLAEAVAYSQVATPDVQDQIRILEEQVKQLKGVDRTRAQAKLKQFKNPKRYASELGLVTDDTFLTGLALVINTFREDSFEMTFSVEFSDLLFRCVLERTLLRTSASRLRALYGAVAQYPFTVLGQVTSFGEFARDSDKTVDGEALRDSFRQMFKASAELERFFLTGGSVPEVTLRPLAIYSELELNILR